ncbi:MAG: methyltransferase [Pseudomonadota bacterium]
MDAMLWSLVGVSAAVAWIGLLRYSDTRPDTRLWPPHQGSLPTAVWAWGLTLLIYLGVLQAGFADPNSLGLSQALRWGLGGALVVAGTIPHSWGTLALGIKGTSGYPVALSRGGIYGWRRHPQYLGQTLMLLGLAVFAGTLWAVWPAVAGACALGYAAFVEDRHLAATAPEHAAYRGATRAFL